MGKEETQIYSIPPEPHPQVLPSMLPFPGAYPRRAVTRKGETEAAWAPGEGRRERKGMAGYKPHQPDSGPTAPGLRRAKSTHPTCPQTLHGAHKMTRREFSFAGPFSLAEETGHRHAQARTRQYKDVAARNECGEWSFQRVPPF